MALGALTYAWTFVWKNASDNVFVLSDTAMPCNINMCRVCHSNGILGSAPL